MDQVLGLCKVIMLQDLCLFPDKLDVFICFQNCSRQKNKRKLHVIANMGEHWKVSALFSKEWSDMAAANMAN